MIRAQAPPNGLNSISFFFLLRNLWLKRRVGWDARLVNEAYTWVEKQIVHQSKLAPLQYAFKGSLLDVGVSPYNGFTYDNIYGTKVGGTIFDRFGRRHTAAELLLTQKCLLWEEAKAMGVMFKDENGNQHQAFLTNN
ncbi:protein HOTHEAD-like [Gossypium australe]|uniref:Protein HOTHEAD-like n=1 Tax=Gossypium australe TaxID=47621 RepID=A0A5B6VI12_9ROSI|nr:protein HOTHEAD-like [Gossypium australe]